MTLWDGRVNRRWFVPAGAAALWSCRRAPLVHRKKSPVAVLKAGSYSDDLVQKIVEGITMCGLQISGKRILLKPNLVEFDALTAINTDVLLVASALEAFERMGAASVAIGEGPGHRRDTYGLAEQAGYFAAIHRFEDRFVDLNRDDVRSPGSFESIDRFYFPQSVLAADLIVTMPKMKTHHWAGVTLSMKNLFGMVPGSVYGWPKNTLHYLGIDRSILALAKRFRNTFAIVDGIVAMEGNGPIQGTPLHAGVLVFGSDLVAVDSTCCRIMGVEPERVAHIAAAEGLGAVAETSIDQRGETSESVRQDFALLPQFAHLRLASERPL